MPRTIETAISRDTVVNQIAAFLHAARLINDSENITDITFGDLNDGKISIKIHFNGERSSPFNEPTKVHVINH